MENLCNRPLTSQNSDLFSLIEQEDFEGILKAVENGANVNVRGENLITPLHLATRKGFLKIVEYLVKNGADIDAEMFNTCNTTPLKLAYSEVKYSNYKGGIKNPNYEVMKYLIIQGCNIPYAIYNTIVGAHNIISELRHTTSINKKDLLDDIIVVIKGADVITSIYNLESYETNQDTKNEATPQNEEMSSDILQLFLAIFENKLIKDGIKENYNTSSYRDAINNIYKAFLPKVILEGISKIINEYQIDLDILEAEIIYHTTGIEVTPLIQTLQWFKTTSSNQLPMSREALNFYVETYIPSITANNTQAENLKKLFKNFNNNPSSFTQIGELLEFVKANEGKYINNLSENTLRLSFTFDKEFREWVKEKLRKSTLPKSIKEIWIKLYHETKNGFEIYSSQNIQKTDQTAEVFGDMNFIDEPSPSETNIELKGAEQNSF